MKLTSAKLFVQVLEHILNEDSTSIDTLQGVPGAVELLKNLHQKRAISHDQAYVPIKKIPWSDLKDSNNIALLAGPNGAGVLQNRNGSYSLYVYDPDTNDTMRTAETSGGRSIKWLEDRIGKINHMWLGRDRQQHQVVRQQRAKLKPRPKSFLGGDELASELLQRFKPLWLRSLTGAQADVKGWVNTQVKNHAFEKAKMKLNHLQNLENAVQAVESGRDLKDVEMVRNAITHAVNQTTQMFYPEQAGGFQSSSSGSRIKLSNSRAVEHLFNDLNAGDTKKLGTLLAFFRKNLVTG